MANMKYLLNCRSFISLIVLFSFFDNFGVKKYDYQFKVLIVGDAVVGKTQIVSRYVKDSFVEEYKYTEGIGLGSKSISFNNKNINLQLYDTSGQERYRTIRQNYYKGSQLIVLVYAINNRNSFENIPKLVEEVKTQNENAKFLLVGNKCDLEKEKRAVTEEEAKQYANENNMVFFEVSAKTGTNIEKMFNSSLQKLLEDMKKEENNNHTYNNTNNFEQKNLLFGDQNKDSIKINKTSCWSEYCSCCPCLEKTKGNVKNIEPVIF